MLKKLIFGVLILIIFSIGLIATKYNIDTSKIKGNKNIIKIQAQNFANDAKKELVRKRMTNENINEICYSINKDGYIGSVYYEYPSGKHEIWISNGELYAYGDSSNLSVIESANIATTSCNN